MERSFRGMENGPTFCAGLHFRNALLCSCPAFQKFGLLRLTCKINILFYVCYLVVAAKCVFFLVGFTCVNCFSYIYIVLFALNSLHFAINTSIFCFFQPSLFNFSTSEYIFVWEIFALLVVSNFVFVCFHTKYYPYWFLPSSFLFLFPFFAFSPNLITRYK